MPIDLCEDCRAAREARKCRDCGKPLPGPAEIPEEPQFEPKVENVSLKKKDSDNMRKVAKGFENASGIIRDEWFGSEGKKKKEQQTKNRESEW